MISDEQEDYVNERAAIREYDGGQPRAAAERGAGEDWVRLCSGGGPVSQGTQGWVSVYPVPGVRVATQDSVNGRKQEVNTNDIERRGLKMTAEEAAKRFVEKYGDKLVKDVQPALEAMAKYVQSPPAKKSECRDCKKEIIWVKNKNEKNIPLDVEPKVTSMKNAYEIRDGNRGWWIAPDKRTGPLHECHFDTCEKRVKKEEPPAAVAEDDVAF
jgi:hypothetical protein